MVMSDFRPKVEIWPFCACVIHPAIIIVTVCALWSWLWGRYHVSQNTFHIYFPRHWYRHTDATDSSIFSLAPMLLNLPNYW